MISSTEIPHQQLDPVPPPHAPEQETLLIKYSLDGKEASEVHVFLDVSSQLLWILPTTPKQDTPLEPLDLLQLKLVETGNKPKDTARVKKLLTIPKVFGSQLVTLHFGDWPWKSYHFACPSVLTASQWQCKVKSALSSCNIPTGCSSTEIWLLRVYSQLKQLYGDQLHAANIIATFSNERIWKSFKLVKDLQKFDPTLIHISTHNPSFSDFRALYYSHVASWRQDIRLIYQRYCDPLRVDSSTGLPFAESPPITPSTRRRISLANTFKLKSNKQHRNTPPNQIKLDAKKAMSINSFAEFLAENEGRPHVDKQEALEIAHKYDSFSTYEENFSDHKYVSLKGFTHYMLSQETMPPPKTKLQPTEKMDKPLSDYFIASSHNTYLTGHQLHGESSVNMYIKVLHSGCRCVELDCWDGEDGEPIIYHGYTLTSKIKFRSVVQAIAENAFICSPYPLILSLENHCSLGQQKKMARYMKDAFGEMLLTCEDEDIVASNLPSPEELKYKILIKHRKIKDAVGEGQSSAKGNQASLLNMGKSEIASAHAHVASPFLGGRRIRPANSRSPDQESDLKVHSAAEQQPQPAKQLPSPVSPMMSQQYIVKKTSNMSLPPIVESPIPQRHQIHSIMEAPRRQIPSIVETSNQASSNIEHHGHQIPTSDPPSSPVVKSVESLEHPHPPLTRKHAFPLGSFVVTNEAAESRKAAGGKVTAKAEMSSVQSSHCATALDDAAKPKLIRDKNVKSSFFEVPERREVVVSEGTEVVVEKQTVAVAESSRGAKKTGAFFPKPDNILLSSSVVTVSTPDLVTPISAPLTRLKDSQCQLQFVPVQRRRSSPTILGYGEQEKKERDRASRKGRTENDIPVESLRRYRQQPTSEQIGKQNYLKSILHNKPPPESQRNSYSLDGSGTFSLDTPQSCRDTEESSYDSKDIAREMSDMVVCTEPVKFTGFKGQEFKVTQMISLSENVAKKAIKKTSKEFLNFTNDHLSRIYPNATRINSLNFNPAYYWIHGCQMVALNYQSNDPPMQQNIALFSQNGGCGYIPKPDHWKDRGDELLGPLSDAGSTQLTITLLSGQHLVKNESLLPIVEIEVIGVASDNTKVKLHASSSSGGCTTWENKAGLSTFIQVMQLAVIKFSLYLDKTSNPPAFTQTVPLASMRRGYQHIYFNAAECDILQPPPSLFMHVLLKGGDAAEPRASLPRDPEAAKPNPLFVNLKVEENMEMTSAMLCVSEPLTSEELIGKVIDKVRLGGRPSQYSLYCGDELIEPASQVDHNSKKLLLKDSPQQFCSVVVDCLDMKGMEDTEPIVMYADKSTTAEDIMAGAVARFSGDLAKAFPHLGYLRDDSQDMEKILQEFCLVLVDSCEDGRFRRVQVLETGTLILRLLMRQKADPSTLLLHTLSQDHHLEPLPSSRANSDSSHYPFSSRVRQMSGGETYPLSPTVRIKRVPPEVVQKSLEEHYSNIRKRTEGRRHGSSDWDDPITMKDIENIAAPGTGHAATSIKTPLAETQKAKKAKCWRRKLGFSHSAEHILREEKREKRNSGTSIESAHTDSPKPKKKWSFRRSSRKRKSKQQEKEKQKKKKQASQEVQEAVQAYVDQQQPLEKKAETASGVWKDAATKTRNASFP